MQKEDSNNLAQNQHNTLGRIGSAWAELTTPETKEQTRRLVNSVLQTPAITSTLGTETQLNTAGDVVIDFFPLSLNPDKVYSVEEDLADQLLALTGNPENWAGVFARPGYPEHPQWTTLFESGYTLSGEYGDLLLWYDPLVEGEVTVDPDSVTTWVLSVPDLITCSRIQRENGTWMLRGVDFQSAPGVVLLYEDPAVAFPGQKATACGHQPKRCFYQYPLQLDGIQTPGYWVTNYYRNQQGLNSFRRAMAEACGLHVWYNDSYIVHRQEMPVGFTYWTEYEKVHAWYPHTGLTVNSQVTRGDIVVDAGDFSVEYNAGVLEITLQEPLFIGTFASTAEEFFKREKPLGIPNTFTIVENT